MLVHGGFGKWTYGKDSKQSPPVDEVLDNFSLHWLTNTVTSGARLYWENRDQNLLSAAGQKTTGITLPVAITVFPDDDLFRAPETRARRASPGESVMPAHTTPPQTANLYLLEDLDDVSKTKQLAKSDLAALRTVSDWIKSFVARPHKDLGRDGPVCPFVPGALERKILWLASEHIADRNVSEVVQLMSTYKSQFLQTPPLNGDDSNAKVIVVVFTDLPAERAEGTFGEVLKQLAVPSYVEDGILFGPFYEGNKGTAIYNSGFRPFQSPVPFLFVRHGVISDWKLFLDNDDWLNLWAHRYGESGVRALAEELRRLPWRARRD